MADPERPSTERRFDRSRLVTAASVLSLAAGTLVMLIGIAVLGPQMLGYTLTGVVPMVLGAVGLARARYRPDESSAAEPALEPMEELKRRYAAGEIEDEELERKVEFLLEADDRRRRRRGTERREAESEPEPETVRR